MVLRGRAMDLKKKKVLVTGAGGFIGSHLVETLLPRCGTITALVKYNSRNDWGNIEFLPRKVLDHIGVETGDIRDPFFVSKLVEGHHIVFHLAALIPIPYSYTAPLSYVHTNIEGTLNVMMACREHGVEKVVHTSTSEVYGTALYRPIDEKHPLQAQSPYSASKIGADKIAESFYLSFGLPVATIRPFNTFGPRQSARAIVPTIVSQALVRDSIEVGSLKPVRDLTFVRDMVDAFIKVAEKKGSIGEVINVGAGKGISIGELAQLILKIMKIDKPLVVDEKRIRPEKSEVMELICDNSKALSVLGWKPKYSLEDGLKETIEHIRENIGRYKAADYNV
jgi:NAD dependent epimerase/dehydratase